MRKDPVFPFVFETSWGWGGAWISAHGVVAFQLPVKSLAKARTLLCKDNLLPKQYRGALPVASAVPDAGEIEGSFTLSNRNAAKNARLLIRQVRRFFEGNLCVFTLPLDWTGRTEFQRLVWQALCKVPYGKTICYGELAAQIGKPRAARAVGHAMATNAIPLIVPCHRVIGADGSMCGFSADGGVPIKQRLLRLEMEMASRKKL